MSRWVLKEALERYLVFAERGRGGSGARPLAARLLRWIGAGNVGTAGRSCGAFDAPRRAFGAMISRKPEPETYLPQPTK
ncbi:MAG: hypothetical protein KBD85_02285 [Elusimicrobia bacterium]|nr:hypothetical protein [Elusimicrobiota bacterium]MBP9698823.1 hypothetical protein [Elusimicrobiota bacterium]